MRSYNCLPLICALPDLQVLWNASFRVTAGTDSGTSGTRCWRPNPFYVLQNCHKGKPRCLCMRRLSDIRDNRRQSMPPGGVAPLIDMLPNLRDLTIYLHKPAEVGTHVTGILSVQNRGCGVCVRMVHASGTADNSHCCNDA